MAVLFPDQTAQTFGGIQGWIVTNLGWYYMLIVGGFVGFVVILSFTRLGRIKLGRDEDEPEFELCPGSPCFLLPGWASGLCSTGSESL